jgi:histidyl-tRNA synthetase
MENDEVNVRLQPILPRGLRDWVGSEVEERRHALGVITDVYKRYGFVPLDTPAMEFAHCIGSFLPDTDRPSGGVFGIQDEDDWLALRYDLTAPLARFVALNRHTLVFPYKRCAWGAVWRNEKPGPGRFREFYQCDADIVGATSVFADAELCAMACEALEALGIPDKGYTLHLNSRKVLDGILEMANIPKKDGNDETRATVLRALDKLDRLSISGVSLLLGEGRKDESGDFTKGAGLSSDQISMIMTLFQVDAESELCLGDNEKMLRKLSDLVKTTPSGMDGVNELEKIAEILDKNPHACGRFVVDPSVVRGLAYYTGSVFEIGLNAGIFPDSGTHRKFGAIAGGGRYDQLVQRYGGEPIAATGISIGIDRLLAAAQSMTSRPRWLQDTHGSVVILLLDDNCLISYQTMALELRKHGISAEVYMGQSRSMGRQLKYADKRQASVAIIEGENEREQHEVVIKDLLLGKELAQGIHTNQEWKEQPAQRSVARSDMVREVLETLERQKKALFG